MLGLRRRERGEREAALHKDAIEVEVPVNHRARKFGTSKYGLGNRAVRATVDMFGVRWLLSRQLDYKIRD